MKRGFQHPDRAGDSRLRLFRGRPRDTHFRLYDVNCVYNIRITRNIVFHAGELFRVLEEPLHFLFRTAIPELEVIEHCIVLLCKAGVCVLNRGHVRAHFVSVVGHIRNCHVRIFRGFLRVPAEGGDKARGKPGHGFHILVCREPGGLVCVVRILHYLTGAILKECLNAAD